jgi:hypothetical protein
MRRPPSLTASGIFATIALAALVAGTPARADEETERDAAVAAAKDEATHWLEALDAGRAVESWNEVASVMKTGRSEQDWIRDVMSPRETLGKSVTREMKSAEFSTSVRGAPQGKYVTVVYLTKFAHSTLVNETVLIMLEDDHWRVAAYSVGRAPEAALPGDEQKAAPSDAKPKG